LNLFDLLRDSLEVSSAHMKFPFRLQQWGLQRKLLYHNKCENLELKTPPSKGNHIITESLARAGYLKRRHPFMQTRGTVCLDADVAWSSFLTGSESRGCLCNKWFSVKTLNLWSGNLLAQQLL
jgi:hypothetical protein